MNEQSARLIRDARSKTFPLGWEALDDLPLWLLNFRPEQIQAITEIVRAFNNGAEAVVLDAPTGSGKTVIGRAVQLLLGERALYVCSSKTLQDQFVHDFPEAKLLKGRNNYPTWISDELTAEDCTKAQNDDGDLVCAWCPKVSECPYEVAKNEALEAELAVLNTSYLLTEINGPGMFKKKSRSRLVILDEADTLEDQLMKYISVQITKRQVEQLELGEPDKVTKADTWLEWVAQAIPKVSRSLQGYPSDVEDIKIIREIKRKTRIYESLKKLLKSLPVGEWIYTGKEGEVAFKPVHVMGDGEMVLWGHKPRFLLMSASIISAEELMFSLGWPQGRYWTEVRMPSSFPVENRQIKIMPIADMSKKVYEVDKAADAIVAILARHPDDRVLVHCVSFATARDLVKRVEPRVSRRCITYDSGSLRDDALRRYLDTAGSVLFAPSLDRGVDLPDDACRVVIIAKVPYPYLGDRQVSARLHSRNGQTWYDVQTVRTVVQMTGRATRHSTDFSTSYIIDSTFGIRLWSRAKRLFPSWWTDALDWKDMVRA